MKVLMRALLMRFVVLAGAQLKTSLGSAIRSYSVNGPALHLNDHK